MLVEVEGVLLVEDVLVEEVVSESDWLEVLVLVEVDVDSDWLIDVLELVVLEVVTVEDVV